MSTRLVHPGSKATDSFLTARAPHEKQSLKSLDYKCYLTHLMPTKGPSWFLTTIVTASITNSTQITPSYAPTRPNKTINTHV